MTVPLDRLYNFLEDIINRDILIYRFYPHGSKKIEDLKPLRVTNEFGSKEDIYSIPPLICNDQEPLNFDYYKFENLEDERKKLFLREAQELSGFEFPKDLIDEFIIRYNLARKISVKGFLCDNHILCHSEKRSPELQKYQDLGFIGVYYWCHALIARDWFRYARVDPILNQPKDDKAVDFLIYNRAWAGTREYRLKFLDLLIENSLTSSCKIKFNPVDSNVHYQDYQFENTTWKPNNQLEKYVPLNTHNPSSSADYNNLDYNQSHIEVVLETLFDDSRIHLTEKTLRPIACGQPFIIAGPYGTLEYLRSYGFKTFDEIINEGYDLIEDPLCRMQTIINELKRLQSLPNKLKIYAQLKEIAEFNRQHFFSEAFFNQVVKEFVDNFNDAYNKYQQNLTGERFRGLRKKLSTKHSHLRKYLIKNETRRQELKKLWTWLHKKNKTTQ